MAEIQDLRFHILRDSMELGSICEIRYRYTLECAPAECDADAVFRIRTEVWGRNPFLDKRIGEASYDMHQLSAHQSQQINRAFIIPCKSLDVELGEDEIYLQVFVIDPLGQEKSYTTGVVKDHF